jgi:PPP family 3-phenylpropionic acid transporter
MSIFSKISSFFFFYFFLVSVYIVFLPKILQTLGYSTLQIGIIFSLGPLMRFAIPFFFLKKLKLDKNIFQIALILTIVSYVLFYFTIKNFYLFIAPNILLGLAFGIMLPYIDTQAIGILKKERYGRARLFGSLGFMICSLVLARNLSDYSVGLNYFIFASILVVFFGFLISLDDKSTKTTQNDTSEKFKFNKTLFLWISLFFVQMSFGIFYNFFTIYETSHGISLKTVSYLWTFSIICEITLFYFQSAFFKRFKLLTLIKTAVLITATRWFLLYLFPSSLAVSYISQSLHAFGFALHHTAVISFLYSVYENKRLSNQFYYGISFGLGGFIGSVFAGSFYGANLFLYASLIALLSLFFLFFQKDVMELKQNS